MQQRRRSLFASHLPGLLSKRPARLAALLAGSVLLASCTIVIVSGPSTVRVGETVTYVLDIGSAHNGFNVTPFVVADVPAGWNLRSSKFEGTVDGGLATGSGTVVAATVCDAGAGGVLPGYQRLHISAGAFFPRITDADTGTVTLEFDVDTQPAGDFQIFFRFGGSGGASACSTPAARTINRRSIPFLSFVQALWDGSGGVEGLDNVKAAAVSPDGRHVLTAASDDNSVAVFFRDSGTGELTFTQVVAQGLGVDGIAGASSVAVSPDGLNVYASGSISDAIAAFSRDAVTGELSFIEALFDGVGGIDGLFGVHDVTVSPEGDSVYTVSSENAVAAFSRNAVTGELSFVQALFNGVGGVDGLHRVESVAVSPDGLHVYVVSSLSHSLAVFSRDPMTGELSFVEALFDGVGGVDGLSEVRSLALSADGRHIYTGASGYLDAVAVFDRDAVTGEPSFVQVLRNGSGGLTGLQNGGSVAVHPSGDYVFVTGTVSVHAFARDAATGELTLVEAQFDRDPPNEGLAGVSSVAVAPDGTHLYATGSRSDSVAAFGTGKLFADGFETGNTTSWSAAMP